jgi:hypothetical protein
MIRDELDRKLRREGIRRDAYDLEGTKRDEAYCLEEESTGWIACYRERGIRRDQHYFESEHDACLYLLQLILNDPSTRIISAR